MNSRKHPKYSETELLDFSQVHIEQFFAICYFDSLSMWRDFIFFA